MSKEEKDKHEEITVWLPEPVVSFLERFLELVGGDLNEFVKNAVLRDLNNMMKGEEIFQTPWTETDAVIKANNLEKVLDC